MITLYSCDIDKAAANSAYGDDRDDLTGLLTDLTLAKRRLKEYAKCNPLRDMKMAISGLDDVISDVRGELAYVDEQLAEYATELKRKRRI